MSPSKEIHNVVDELKRQGWRVEPTNGSHLKAFPPDPRKQMVLIGGSGTRAMKNTIAQLRRSGFKWPPPAKERIPQDEREPLWEDPVCPPDPERSSPQTVDELFSALRDSRTEYQLSVELLKESEERFRAAEAELTDARSGVATSAEAMRAAKVRFDAAFEPDPQDQDREETPLRNERLWRHRQRTACAATGHTRMVPASGSRPAETSSGNIAPARSTVRAPTPPKSRGQTITPGTQRAEPAPSTSKEGSRAQGGSSLGSVRKR